MPYARDTKRPLTQRSYQEALRRLAVLLALPTSLDEMLHALTTLTMELAEADLGVVLLADQQHTRFAAHTSIPDLRDKGAIIQQVEINPRLCQRLQTTLLSGRQPDFADAELEALNPLKNVQYTTLLPLPLLAGNECIGLLICYSSRVMHYSADDLLLLSTIVSQAALAVKHRQGEEAGTLSLNTLADVLLEDLLAGKPGQETMFYRRAHFLGCDLTQPHLALLMELAPLEIQQHSQSASERSYAAIFEQVKQHMLACYPNSLVCAHDRLLIGLLCSGNIDDQVKAWLDQLMSQLYDEHGVHLSAGIGNPYQQVSDYHHSYDEAREALEVEQCLHPQGGCSRYNDLGVYRYIRHFAHNDTRRDQYQDHIACIVEYDQRKKMNLLDTLETYLECGGNIAKAASLLEIHRNTLLQRLDRLQSLCGCYLQTDFHRLPLLVAIKIYRLRIHRSL